MRRLPRTLLRLSTAIIDQAVFGLGTFVISWWAARHMEADAFATFSLAWVWGWSLAAVGNEAVATPLSLRLAAGKLSQRSTATFLSGVVALGSGATAAVLLAGIVIEPPVWAIAGWLAAAGLSIMAARRFTYMRVRVVTALAGSSLRFALAAGAIAATHALTLTTVQMVAIASIASIVAAAAMSRAQQLWRRQLWRRQLWSEMIRLCVHGWHAGGAWLASATLVRILGFSAGLLSLVAVTQGAEAVALLGGFGVLASGAQLFSASLPLVLQPAVSAAFGSASQLRAEVTRYVVIAVLLGCLVATGSAVLFDFGVRTLLGDGDVASVLEGLSLPFAALSGALVLSSALSGLLAALEHARLNFAVVAASGTVTLAAVLLGVPTSWIASIPYAAHATVAGVISVALVLHPHTGAPNRAVAVARQTKPEQPEQRHHR